jgi:hypothetical protein
MDTRNTKRSKLTEHAKDSSDTTTRLNDGTYLLPGSPKIYFNVQNDPRDEALRKKGKRQGTTFYVSVREDSRGGLSKFDYNIDESSDDEYMAEMALKPVETDHLRVKSKEIKKYDDLEEGLERDGKRLSKTIKISSTGKCIRRIYDLDEASSDEEQPIVKKIHSKKQTKKTSKCLSDMYDVQWPGYASTETSPPVKIKPDYPYGTTRSGSNPEMKVTSKDAFHQRINKVFKPASLRQEEPHLKNENPQVNGEFQWERGQKPSEDIIEQVTNIKPFQNKRFLRCS